jgi:hypothetical protein|eukprot:CAMPEP_0174385240 /NCGR_PEP_ID=MMETSP0811_2-20130205/126463_1 /TAXON_ID=73025 ORGANISM="Eutreptiella gymnastica-like, Strain CCMP1594" /NCGR_SAMPLE_ID=MMETSP0811_2 /ASSEMBLY_ACC=CAM_ASM_000667 /LENGTH=97 /DNA_ID=CAMNT_0015539485 /DNA_START=1494 /DNA_END=1787 /DNA_ORIENTATION=-
MNKAVLIAKRDVETRQMMLSSVCMYSKLRGSTMLGQGRACQELYHCCARGSLQCDPGHQNPSAIPVEHVAKDGPAKGEVCLPEAVLRQPAELELDPP